VTSPSPQILDHEWGRIVIDGVGEVKDAKLWPGGGRAWDWTETGTRHQPGIQPADVTELLDAGTTAVVLGIGRQEALGVCPETCDALHDTGVVFQVLRTDLAVAAYNQLALTTPVGGLFHSTC
jgi:hypothetical protein